jgi:hypothetical protein
VQARIFGHHGRVPLLAVDDEGVRRTRHLLLRLGRDGIDHELIVGVVLRWRRSSVCDEDRAVVLDRSSHEVVGEKVDAQVHLADLGVEVLTEMLTADVSEVHHLWTQTNLRHGRLEWLEVVAVKFASSDK